MVVRLWILVLVVTLISWLLLKAVGKPKPIGWVFLFWVVTILGGTAFFYGISVWFVSQQ